MNCIGSIKFKPHSEVEAPPPMTSLVKLVEMLRAAARAIESDTENIINPSEVLRKYADELNEIVCGTGSVRDGN